MPDILPEAGRSLRHSFQEFMEKLKFGASPDGKEAYEEKRQEPEEQPDTKVAQENNARDL